MEVKEPTEIHFSSHTSLPSSSRWWSKETVAIVTGANKGIGYSVVRQLAELGLTVILTARDVDKGRKALHDLLSQNHSLLLHFHCLDVSDPPSIDTFVSWFKKNFGFLDILVNNAAVSFKEIHENTVEYAETVMKTNFYGAKLLTETLLPLFRRSHSISRILNITSRLGSINKMRNLGLKEMLESEKLSEEQIVGMTEAFLEQVKKGTWERQGWPEIWTDYALSKMALNAYSRVLANKQQGHGLSVNCFCPGFTRTSMTRGKGIHTPDDAAQLGATLALLAPHRLPTAKFFIATFIPPTPAAAIVSKL